MGITYWNIDRSVPRPLSANGGSSDKSQKHREKEALVFRHIVTFVGVRAILRGELQFKQLNPG